jgi:hypothetical protein
MTETAPTPCQVLAGSTRPGRTPTRDYDLLELAALGSDTSDPVIAHAMRVRPQ